MDKKISSNTLEIKFPEKIDTSFSEGINKFGITILSYFINIDQVITIDDYHNLCHSLRSLFGNDFLDYEENRIHIFETILNPPIEISDIQKSFYIMAQKTCISSKFIEDFINAILDICLTSQAITEQGTTFIKNCISEFNISNAEIAHKFNIVKDKFCVSDYKYKYENIINRLMPNTILSLIKKNQKTENITLVSSKRVINESANKELDQLKFLSTLICDQELYDGITDFEASIQDDTYKISIIGEFKHGKSTLFNSLIKQEVSPIKDSTPTTSTIFELSYSKKSIYEAFWMNDDEISRIKNYIKLNSSNKYIKEFNIKFESLINSDYFSSGGKIKNINSLADISKYVGVEGVFSCAIRKVSVKLPIDVLKNGIIIVDTPGINDPMKVRDFITLKEGISSDCILFVLRADKLCTDSETSFLRSLITEGKLSKLIFIVTHVANTNDKDYICNLDNYIRNWALNVSDDFSNNIAGIYFINPNTILDKYKNNNEVNDEHYFKFLNKLASICNEKTNSDQYELMLRTKINTLKQLAQNKISKFLTVYSSKLPSSEIISSLNKQSQKFTQISDSYKMQITMRISSIASRLVFFKNKILSDFDLIYDEIVVTVKEMIESEVMTLDKNYDKFELWEKFDKETVPIAIQSKVNGFLRKYENEFMLWNDELTKFSEEISLNIKNASNELYSQKKEFFNLTKSNNVYHTIMCKFDSVADLIEKGAIISTGSLAFLGITSLALHSTVLFTVIGGIASIHALPFIVAGAAGLWGVNKIFSDPKKRKHDFIERKINSLEKYLPDHFNKYKEYITSNIDLFGAQFVQITETKYGPLIKAFMLSAEDFKLQALFFEKLNSDFIKVSQSMHKLIS